MKQRINLILFAAFSLLILATSCSGKKVFCGCPNEKGFVGYK